jgi:branched-chain amino acid transport system substrate-binding protein
MEDATAATAFWLADSVGAAAIVGPATSSQTSVAYTTLNLENTFGTLVISPSATSPALTTLDGLKKTDEDPGLLWRTAPPDSLQGTVQALDMRERGTRRVAAIYEDGVYGNGLVDAFIAEFEDDTHTADRLPFSDASQRDVAVQGAGDDVYDEVLFISGEITDMIAFLDGASQVGGYETRPIFLADGARDDALLDGVNAQARELLPNIRGTAPSSPQGDVYETFAAAYAAAFNPDTADASAYTAYTYDAAWLAIYGTAWSQYQEASISGTGIARGLRKLSAGDPLVVRSNSWADLRAHFAVASAVDVQGASGELDYDPATEETTAPIDVWVVDKTRDGFTTVQTYSP